MTVHVIRNATITFSPLTESERHAELKRRRLIRSLQSAPVRKCFTVHGCALCLHDIKLGEHYADRGYGRRAHYDCVPGLGTAAEPWQCEERSLLRD